MKKIETTEVTRNQIINQLLQIGHGRLSIFNDIGMKTVNAEPELFAHLIAYNAKKGEVRDSKVALPVLALRGANDEVLFENAAAHLCKLDVKDFLRAMRYHKGLSAGSLEEFEIKTVKNKKEKVATTVKFSAIKPKGGSKWIDQAVYLYLTEREKNRKWWEATAVQHRNSLKTLYAMFHVKPNSYAQRILFDRIYPASSVFNQIAQLKNMKADEAAGAILNYKIPFLIAVGALGGIKGKTDILLALIERMSGNELINNSQMLQKAGVFDNAALKAAYDNAVNRMKKDKRVSTLKAGKAASVVKDATLAKKLEDIQEDRLAKLGGIDGDWLVLADRSGSMSKAIDVAQHVSSLIAKQVNGTVHLVFFNAAPTYFNVTGKSLEDIKRETKYMVAQGMTSIGCGLDYIAAKGIVVNGIAICSDGGDNTAPLFHIAYEKYVKKFSIEPTVYLFHTEGDTNHFVSNCKYSNIPIEVRDCTKNVDYYSFPAMVQTLRTCRYSLVDSILEIPLLTFKDVFGEIY